MASTKPQPGKSLAETYPKVAIQADGWDPKSVGPFSRQIQRWRCEKGHLWSVKVASLTAKNIGCPVCSNRKVLAGFNDLATTHPELALQAVGWDPTTIIAGSNKKLKWQCIKGHIWSAKCQKRSAGSSCPVCSNRKVLAGFNDLATTHPELALQAVGWDPTAFSFGSKKKLKWRCKESHIYSTAIAWRTTSQSGCPTCAKGGFDPNEDGWFYLIRNDDLEMFQIGITNNPEDRLSRHARSQWAVMEIRGPMDGRLTQELETNCLHALERHGAILGHKAGIEKFDGYSEAWTKSSLYVISIKQILDWVYEDESKGNHGPV